MDIKFHLNGKRTTIDAHPMERLLDVLRNQCGLTGTKEGCGEGECGACTVLLDGECVMSCMIPVCQAEGAQIETIEGVLAGAEGAALHPVQRAFIEHGGAQCGICTPGMIIAAVSHLRHPERAPGGIAEALEGNLCRCTGYMRIFAAFEQAEREYRESVSSEQ